MLNLSALYPYFLILLVSSTLVPGTTAAAHLRSSRAVENPLTAETTAISNGTNINDDSKSLLGLCLILDCYTILCLIQQLQVQLGCATILDLQILLTQNYNTCSTCNGVITSACLNLGISVTLILGLLGLKEGATDGITTIDFAHRTGNVTTVGSSVEITDISSRGGSSCNCNLIALLTQIVDSIVTVSVSSQCHCTDLRPCTPAYLKNLCKTCICLGILG